MVDSGARVSVLHAFDAILPYEPTKTSTGRHLRPHSTPATLMWLEDNYEMAEGVCIPRNVVYLQYADFSSKNSMQPVNPASFGKIMRQQFPQLTTRRLGTRGQSRYHYYGIAIRETSQYYQPSYARRMATNGDARRENTVRQMNLTSTKYRFTSVLPEFPHLNDFNLPPNCDTEKLNTFLMMYKTHSQRILDTVVRASFDEVQAYLLHFWQGVPPHLSPLLGSNALVNLVGVCDSVLYRGISNVILPSILQAFPDSLTKAIQHFIQELESWLKMALYNLPESLRNVKLEMARRFAQLLRRRISLNHLAQASRLVVRNGDISGQMLQDWRQVDATSVARETLFSTTELGSDFDDPRHAVAGARTVDFVLGACREFENLLEVDASLDAYVEWLDSLVSKCITAPCGRRRLSVRDQARQFLLIWSDFGTRVIRDMTLHSAASFGSFHLLRLMFDDYVLYLVENSYLEDQVREFMDNIANDSPPTLLHSGDYDPELFLSKEDMPLASIHPRQTLQTPPFCNTDSYIVEMVTTSSVNGVNVTLEPLLTSGVNDEEDDDENVLATRGRGPSCSSSPPQEVPSSLSGNSSNVNADFNVVGRGVCGATEDDVMGNLGMTNGKSDSTVTTHVWNGEYYQSYGSMEVSCIRTSRPGTWSSTSSMVSPTSGLFRKPPNAPRHQNLYLHQLNEPFVCMDSSSEEDVGAGLRHVNTENSFECSDTYCETRHFEEVTTGAYPAYPSFSKSPQPGATVAPPPPFDKSFVSHRLAATPVGGYAQEAFVQS